MTTDTWHVDHTTDTWERRKAEADAHPGEPCYQDAADAVDPRRNDPVYTDPPEHLLRPRDRFGDRTGDA